MLLRLNIPRRIHRRDDPAGQPAEFQRMGTWALIGTLSVMEFLAKDHVSI